MSRCSTGPAGCWIPPGKSGSGSASSGSRAATSISTAPASFSPPSRSTTPRSAPAPASYEATRETLRALKSFGINIVYTHNYGCEPGSHLSFAEVLRAADDVGMLVSFSQPHFGHYDWKPPDADRTNGYARHAEFYARAARNHPSVVFYSMSHNATGYEEDMNPDLIDGVTDPRPPDGQEQLQARPAGRGHRPSARPGPHRLPPLLGQPGLDAHRATSIPTSPRSRSSPTGSSTGRQKASSRCSPANTGRRSPGTGRCIAAGTRASGPSAAPGCPGSSASPSGMRSSSATGPSASARWRRPTCAGRPSSSGPAGSGIAGIIRLRSARGSSTTVMR